MGFGLHVRGGGLDALFRGRFDAGRRRLQSRRAHSLPLLQLGHATPEVNEDGLPRVQFRAQRRIHEKFRQVRHVGQAHRGGEGRGLRCDTVRPQRPEALERFLPEGTLGRPEGTLPRDCARLGEGHTREGRHAHLALADLPGHLRQDRQEACRSCQQGRRLVPQELSRRDG